MVQEKQTETGAQPTQSATDGAPTADQILQNSWAATIDAQTAQQFTTLSQIRQARANQLQREATSLLKAYGPTDPGVLAVQASLQYEQTFGSRLGVVSTTTSTAAPAAPANGWVIYGHVRNADGTPAPQLTVFLADDRRAWLSNYAYAFTDQTGYFALTYTPTATAKKARQTALSASDALSAYLEVSNDACKLMYVDATPMSITVGATIYRDVTLAAGVPLGTPPCEPGAPGSTPPAQTTGNK